MSELNKVDQAAYEAMRKAHAFCPSELSHLDKIRWMADFFVKNYTSQSPAPIPEQAASIEGLTKVDTEEFRVLLDKMWNAMGSMGAARARNAIFRHVERLLATQSAKQGVQPDDVRDAERYRWLRDQRGIQGDLPIDGDVWVVQFRQPQGVIPELRCAGFGVKLDAAIDVAMQSKRAASTDGKGADHA